jgi:hypothetical protein
MDPKDLAGVEQSLSKAIARRKTGRCLRCDLDSGGGAPAKTLMC